MFRFLLRFWPALIPLVLYFLWLLHRKKRAAAGGEETPPEVLRGAFFWSLAASFVLLLASFLVLGLSQKPQREGHYVPPHYEGGKLAPAHTEPEQP